MAKVTNSMNNGRGTTPNLQDVLQEGNDAFEIPINMQDGSNIAQHTAFGVTIYDEAEGKTLNVGAFGITGTINDGSGTYVGQNELSFIKPTTGVCNFNFPDKPVGYYTLATVEQANNFANDAAAAIGGVAVGHLYHTAGIVKIRMT